MPCSHPAVQLWSLAYLRSPSPWAPRIGSAGPRLNRQVLDKRRRALRHAVSVPVVTQLVTVEDFPVRRRTIGILESPATVIIRSRIDSQVLEQHVTDGEIVKKRRSAVHADDREIKATIARDEATIAKDQAAFTQAEAALRRTQELISKNVAPQQQLEQATAAYKAAQQTVERYA